MKKVLKKKKRTFRRIKVFTAIGFVNQTQSSPAAYRKR